jgi:hypothetical protein
MYNIKNQHTLIIVTCDLVIVTITIKIRLQLQLQMSEPIGD